MKQVDSVALHRSTGKLEVYLFNVGQGDHIMIRFPEGQYGIIDFYYDSSNKMPETPILSYFKDLKKKLPEEEFKKITISFCCISHTDIDHIKGISSTIEWFWKHGLLIKEFWLGAARDESELIYLFKTNIDKVIDALPVELLAKIIDNVGSYDAGIIKFLDFFEKWKKKDFNNSRYNTEPIGKGEYLANIRQLRNPCPVHDISALNMGPLDSHITGYIAGANTDFVMKLLGVETDTDTDNNYLSHILRIRYGTTNLLFGGDTHKQIWEECLDVYDDPAYPYRATFGDYASRFIKVSHHGSKNSSSEKIWSKIIAKHDSICMGISAGQHKRYKHPHAQTLHEIRTCSKNAEIFATNVCHKCVTESELEKEYHIWYDDFIIWNKYYGKVNPDIHDFEIEDDLQQMSYEEDIREPDACGLLAYIFEIPKSEKEKIRPRIALAGTLRKEICFYEQHVHKLNEQCR